tara:strand:+ start:193 stop:354 length:162 start_codon:yes stop_codon:yes gene_type:complete
MPNKIDMFFPTNKKKVLVKGSVNKMSSGLSSNLSNVRLNNLQSIYMHKGGSCG